MKKRIIIKGSRASVISNSCFYWLAGRRDDRPLTPKKTKHAMFGNWGMMNWGGDMMGWGGAGWGLGGFFVVLTWLVWTVVGILLIAWLWRQLKK